MRPRPHALPPRLRPCRSLVLAPPVRSRRIRRRPSRWSSSTCTAACRDFRPTTRSWRPAASMTLAELPGAGLGVQVGVHIYPFTMRVRSRSASAASCRRAGRRQTPTRRRQRVRRCAPRKRSSRRSRRSCRSISATGHGWSYLSGGIGASTWSLVPDGLERLPAEHRQLKTINYGGGARWFIKPHLAFSFDVRFYAINPGSAYHRLPGEPAHDAVHHRRGRFARK